MTHLQACISNYAEAQIIENIAVKAGIGDHVLLEVYQSPKSTVDQNTLFDMASVTKIIVTTTAALIALDRKLFSLDDFVHQYISCPPDKSGMTIRHLLTHTMGIGYRDLRGNGVNYENVASYILNIPNNIPIGQDVQYSCPGFILLGKILENVFGAPLDDILRSEITEPLQMTSTSFLPDRKTAIVNHNLAEHTAGIVNDNNCRFLGGISGNAGIFSNMHDMTLFAKFLLQYGSPLIRKETFQNAIANHTPSMSAARGLGFLYVDERYAQTGSLFPVGSFGHCGHTGQSLFVDPVSGLYAIILSDATVATKKKYGAERYQEVMTMRKDLHNAILNDLDIMNRRPQ